MLDKIQNLYLQGKLNNGMFAKTAKLILEMEIEKIAGPSKDAVDAAMKVVRDALKTTARPAATTAQKMMSYAKANPFRTALGTMAGIGAVNAGVDMLSKNMSDGKMDEVFLKIMAMNPELSHDKAKINFDSLKSLSPTMALDFAAAEGYLRQMEQYPYLHPAQVSSISMVEKNVADARARKPGTGISGILSSLGKTLASLVAFGSD